ncbi:MAG: biopolymer transporter ExbD [Sandaracinaceae bacterium]|jgi:biopolymer transport protein ExbD|nr:biopolymer transporter ExbD [Sandaracinaceae bacterium]
MAGGSSSDRGGMISGINVTPLVDITLVLLIILMVTAKIVVSPAVPMNLPQASHTEQVQVVFTVLMDREGRILANGHLMRDDTSLLATATRQRREHSDLRAVIQADGEVTHRRVIHMLDILHRAGIDEVAFAVEPIAEVAP